MTYSALEKENLDVKKINPGKQLNLNNKKAINLKKYRDNYTQEKNILDNYPLEIFAEVANTCNIRCIMCCETGNKWKNVSPPFLPISLVEKIQDSLDHAIMFHAFGYGEPLCNKDFIKLIQYVKDKNLFLDFFTNAVLLDANKSSNIISNGVNCIYVSINGATKNTYEKIHCGASFNKIVENLIKLNEIKKEFKSHIPELKINMIAMNSNFEEIPEIVKLAKKVGITAIEIKPLLVYDHMPDLKKKYRAYNPERDDPIINKTIKIAYETGILVNFDIYKETKPQPKKSDTKKQNRIASLPKRKEDILCFQPWKTFYIRADGLVRPCCFYNHGDFETDKLWLGNLHTQTIEEIWNGPAYQQIRDDLKSGRIPKGCEYCMKYNLRPKIDDCEAIFNIIQNNPRKSIDYNLKFKIKLFLMRYFGNDVIKHIKKPINYVKKYF